MNEGLKGIGKPVVEPLRHGAGRVRRLFRKAPRVGTSPGSLEHVGERRAERLRITIHDYDPEGFRFREAETIEECFAFRDTATVTWINVDGLHEAEAIGRLCAHFGVHPLVVEDILHTGQRPKVEDHGSYLYIVLNMLNLHEERLHVDAEQLSLLVGKNFVISFQERPGDIFDPVRRRIREGTGRIRGMGADYCAYALLDLIVDHYFVVLERLDERIALLEEEVLVAPTNETMQGIHHLKREMIFLRKSVWPLREVIGNLDRSTSTLVTPEMRPFLRDVYDHTIQAIDAIESFRDMLSGMLDLYLSTVSNRMNEVMKVLTIMATIMLPLTLIAGVYGMNFDVMPELRQPWAYPVVLLVMLGLAVGMLGLFRRKGWL